MQASASKEINWSEIIREGSGRADAREYVESGELEKEKNKK